MVKAIVKIPILLISGVVNLVLFLVAIIVILVAIVTLVVSVPLMVSGLPETMPHITIFALLFILAFTARFYRSEWIKTPELVSYILLTLLIVSWTVFMNAFATEMCRGTNVGSNLSLRLCQPYVEVPVLIGVVVGVGISLATFWKLKISVVKRQSGMFLVFLGLFVASSVIWFTPLFMVHVN